MSTLLQVRGLQKHYGIRPIFTDASLVLQSDQKIGVIGRNGAGKSTLFRMLMGTEEPDAAEWATSAEFRPGYLSQDNEFQADETVLEFLERSSGRESWHCARMADRFQIPADRLDFKAADLSGGYQMRLRLSSMLLAEPNFLLLDEPTNYLDLQTLLLLEEFLQKFNGGFMIISHDREFLRNTCTHTLEVESGELFLFPGNVDDYLEFKHEREAERIRFNRNVEAKRKQLASFVERFRAKASKAAQAQSKLKQLGKLQTLEVSQSLANVRIRIPPVVIHKGQAVRFEEADLGYPDKLVASGVDLLIPRGAHVAVVGANGQGKSTLLKTLAGELPTLSGRVHWNDEGRGYYAQHVYGTLPEKLNVYECLARAATPNTPRQEILDLAAAFLFQGTDVEKKVSVLSGGERARVSLAGLLLSKKSALLLDEPTNHLDFETVEALGFALRDYQGTLVFVSHDRTFVNLVANQVIEVHEGSVRLFPGNYQDYVYRLSQLQHGEPTGEEPPPNGKSAAKSVGPSTSGGSESNGSASPRKGSSAAPPEQSSQDSHAERKRKRSLLGRSRTELTKLEADVARLEKRRDELLAILSDPDQFSLERNEELAKISEQLLKAEEAYLATVATIEELETSVGAQQ